MQFTVAVAHFAEFMEIDTKARVLVTPEELIGYNIDGRYRLDAIVGGGGMGVVYRTTQQNLNRTIAIKLLKLEDHDGTHRIDRFRREIDIVAQLSHPNIVRVFDSGRDELLGLHYIAMELVDGTSLDELMRHHRIQTALAIDIAYEIAAALTEPHQLGIVHRDIKPANVLITARSDDTVGVKVVDFGIARDQSRGGAKITTTGVVVGSPMYMAPEVARGETLDGRTDLYSLGIMLYEMITGVTPFGGTTPVAIMLQHAVAEPPSMASVAPDDFAFPELVVLVDSLLHKERSKRPEDAKAVMRRLDDIRRKYEIARPVVDASASVTAAFAPFLVPHQRASNYETSPYDVTQRLDDEAVTDGFAGWLVSSTASRALFPPLSEEPPVRTEVVGFEPTTEVGAPPWRAIAIAVFVVAMLVSAAVVVVLRPTTQPEQIGEPLEGLVVEEPVVKEPVVEEAVVDALVFEQPVAEVDAGVNEDAATNVAPATPVVDPTPKRIVEPAKLREGTTAKGNKSPTTQPPEPTQPVEQGDDFKKGMEWLHQK